MRPDFIVLRFPHALVLLYCHTLINCKLWIRVDRLKFHVTTLCVFVNWIVWMRVDWICTKAWSKCSRVFALTTMWIETYVILFALVRLCRNLLPFNKWNTSSDDKVSFHWLIEFLNRWINSNVLILNKFSCKFVS